MNHETIFLMVMWGTLAIICITIEILTTNLITIWFALASIVALIITIFDVVWYWQIISFLMTTIITLIAGYPLLKKYVHYKLNSKTNIEALINQKAIMLTDYPINDKTVPTAKLDGKTWTVINFDNETFKKNEKVLVTSITGVKLVINKIKKE